MISYSKWSGKITLRRYLPTPYPLGVVRLKARTGVLTGVLLALILSVVAVPSVALGAKISISPSEVKTFFPLPSELPGGSRVWIKSSDSSDLKKKGDSCDVISTAYNYFSTKPSVKLGVERQSSYPVDVRVFSCVSLEAASDQFHYLSAIGDNEHKVMVDFGDKATLLVLPYEGTSKTDTQQASYYLTFIKGVFVTQVHSTDGFSLMDIADFIDISIANLMKRYPDMFMITSLAMVIQKDGFVDYHEDVLFAENITALDVHGEVYDSLGNPMDGATVRIPTLNATTTTDGAGRFRIAYNVNKNYTVKLTKVIYMHDQPGKTSRSNALVSGVYDLKMFMPNKPATKYRLALQVRPSQGGKYRLAFGNMTARDANNSPSAKNYPVRGKIYSNGSLELIVNCKERESIASCRQVLKSSNVGGDIVSGAWSGTGPGGMFELYKNSYTKRTIRVRLDKSNLDLSSIELDAKNTTINRDDQPFISNDPKRGKRYIEAVFSPIKDKRLKEDENLFAATLVLQVVPSSTQVGSIPVYAYTLQGNSTARSLYQQGKVATLTPSTDSYQFRVPLEGGSNNFTAPLIGPVSYNSSLVAHHLVGDVDSLRYAPFMELTYYLPRKSAQPKSFITVWFNDVDKADYVSNGNLLKNDGRDDAVLNVNFNSNVGKLDLIELSIPSVGLKYNTVSGDSAPCVALAIQRNSTPEATYTLASHKTCQIGADGSGSVAIKQGDKARLYIYKHSALTDALRRSSGKLMYKIRINGTMYEGVVTP